MLKGLPCEDHRNPSAHARANTFLTEVACQWPPRGVETPRAFKASAMSLRVPALQMKPGRCPKAHARINTFLTVPVINITRLDYPWTLENNIILAGCLSGGRPWPAHFSCVDRGAGVATPLHEVGPGRGFRPNFGIALRREGGVEPERTGAPHDPHVFLTLVLRPTSPATAHRASSTGQHVPNRSRVPLATSWG
jgi:hypothetical protein